MKDKEINKILGEVKDVYQQIAVEFSQTRSGGWEIMRQLVNRVSNNSTVLDWGCGNGRLYESLVDKHVDYLGLDNCSALLQKAQGKYPQAQWRVSSDLPEQKFDYIFAIASLHHLPGRNTRQQQLLNFSAHLRQGGEVFITTWNLKQQRYWWSYLYNSLINLGRGWDWGDVLMPWKINDQQLERYCHNFTIKELSLLAERAGLKVLDCYYENRGQRTNWRSGKNLVLIAKKI